MLLGDDGLSAVLEDRVDDLVWYADFIRARPHVDLASEALWWEELCVDLSQPLGMSGFDHAVLMMLRGAARGVDARDVLRVLVGDAAVELATGDM